MATEIDSILGYEHPLVPVCTKDGYHDWFWGLARIVIKPKSDKSAYTVKVYAKVCATDRISWMGNCDLKVTCKSSSGKSYTGSKEFRDGEFSMYTGTHGSDVTNYDGPVTFEVGAPGDITLTFSINLDLTPTNGGKGIKHVSDGGYIKRLKLSNHKIDVSEIPLIAAPKIKSLKNTNPYNGDQNVSASQTSISVSWEKKSDSDSISGSKYKITGETWKEADNKLSQKITGLTRGTSYEIKVKSYNSAGDSDVLTKTIRTRYDEPYVGIVCINEDMETLTFRWIADRTLQSGYYSVDGGPYIQLFGNSALVDGQFSIVSQPNTIHTIYFYGVSTSNYDSLTSNTAVCGGRTLDISHITAIDNCVFGLPISLYIQSQNNKTHRLSVTVRGNNRSSSFEFNIAAGSRTFSFTPNQSQLDGIYMCFSNSNSVEISFQLFTIGVYNTYTEGVHFRSLVLTGIAKTAHIGVSNVQRRAQVYIGVGNSPKRAVAWVGVGGVPRRCI